jgi:hypothetical protein
MDYRGRGFWARDFQAEAESFDNDLDTALLVRFADASIGLLRGEIPAEPGTSTAY